MIGNKHVTVAFNNHKKPTVLLQAGLGACPRATENSGILSSGFAVFSVWEVGGHPTASVGLLCKKV